MERYIRRQGEHQFSNKFEQVTNWLSFITGYTPFTVRDVSYQRADNQRVRQGSCRFLGRIYSKKCPHRDTLWFTRDNDGVRMPVFLEIYLLPALA